LLRLGFFQYRNGVEVPGGNRITYDVGRNEAYFGAASVDGHALVWELGEEGEPLELDSGEEWLMRCDRVDFPPGGVAYLHTHQGPGIRCLLNGQLTVETGGRSIVVRPFETWFESGPEPVYAAASDSVPTAFVRVMVLPRRLLGQSSIRYVNPEDADKPKPQRYTVFVDQPIEL
jgi:quercetin dioxygenase-like cupin family protein